MGLQMILRSAAIGYAVATVFGSAVSRRHDLPGEPLGLNVPISVSRSLMWGLGAGTAIPWPMAVVAGFAAFTAVGGNIGRERWSRGIAIVSVFGTIVEPVTWGRRVRGADVTASVVLNLAASAALALASRQMAARRPS